MTGSDKRGAHIVSVKQGVGASMAEPPRAMLDDPAIGVEDRALIEQTRTLTAHNLLNNPTNPGMPAGMTRHGAAADPRYTANKHLSSCSGTCVQDWSTNMTEQLSGRALHSCGIETSQTCRT